MARFIFLVEMVIPVIVQAGDADEALAKLVACPPGEIIDEFATGEPKMTVPREPASVIV